MRELVTNSKHSSIYDILSPTTATIDYAIGLEKLAAKGQFFGDA